jgi:23S rRNA pseudouridine1911/1915/1917 synthase
MANIEISKAQRLDQKVIELIPELSRSFANKLIVDGKVLMNGKLQLKPGTKVRDYDIVDVDYDVAELGIIPEIELEVIYEDDDCVVINKPVGLLTHSKGAFNPEATVATWIRTRLKDLEGSRGGIVHRLDRMTSGVMICAKNPEAMAWLQKQFSQRNTKKEYLAVIKGEIAPSEAVIDMPIERNPKAPSTFRVGQQGKEAQTTYHTLETGNGYSLLDLQPRTGRTHQLRVHLASQGHPIVGDVLYGGEEADRLYLHAAKLEITIPDEHKRLVFEVPTPDSFRKKLQ